MAALLAAPAATAHEASFPIEGVKLKLRADNGKKHRRFAFKAVGKDVIRVANHDPAADGAAIVVNGTGRKPGSSGRITLDPVRWKRVENKRGKLQGWAYRDRTGSRGGITKVRLENGSIRIKGRGKNLAWKPAGRQESVWIHFYLEGEQFCAQFGDETAAEVSENRKGRFKASGALRPGSCPDQVCGNGVQEFGEECDDGNADGSDQCSNTCQLQQCGATEFASTYDAIQEVIFDNATYACTNGACHGNQQQGSLDLRPDASFDALVDVTASINPGWVRIFPGDIDKSLLYEKLVAKVEGRDAAAGSSMPTGGQPILQSHLDALADWIRAGAPREGVVLGTPEKLGACLPDPTPLKIDPPPVPDEGRGVQFQQTAWPLPANSEDEICMATFYDLRDTGIVPDGAEIPCPETLAYDPDDRGCSNDLATDCTEDADCQLPGPGPKVCMVRRNVINPEGRCFAFHKQELVQDPQSHHSIVHIYAGGFGENDERWGPWTYKFNDVDDPRNGQACDPTDVDPELGYNPGCSGVVSSSVACNLYGPPDVTQFAVASTGGTLPQFSGSQETYYELEFADGVYSELPMRGMIVWNSHAFNLTDRDTTMAQYLNLDFALDENDDQRWPSFQLFDARYIFDQYVKPFETEEYCATSTLPQGSRLFRLASHMHERGVLWRTWAPPNEPCRPPCPLAHPNAVGFFGCDPEWPPGVPLCDGPPENRDPIYLSTVYNDPLQLDFDPPMELDSPNAEDRTFLYCARYDNGATPGGPEVKLYSGSPMPPINLGDLGGPCGRQERACLGGPSQGKLCDATLTGIAEESFCETKPGAGDGLCDACPVRGGVTTEDEMFINLGNYYVLPVGN